MENRQIGGKFGWWTPIARVYEPIQAGSIDGTDTIPHDRAIIRALKAEYHPNKLVVGNPRHTIFVGRLSAETTEDTLIKYFSRFGEIERCRLVRDVVTGYSKRYAFIEYVERLDASKACDRCEHVLLDEKEILVEMEVERNMHGWVPRRLGGGWGGKKESGQLRFGGRARRFQRPIVPVIWKRNQDNQYPHYIDDDKNSDKRTHRIAKRSESRYNRRSRSPREVRYEKASKHESRHYDEQAKYRRQSSHRHGSKHTFHDQHSSGHKENMQRDYGDDSDKYSNERMLRFQERYSDDDEAHYSSHSETPYERTHSKKHKKKHHKKRSRRASSDDSITDSHSAHGDEGAEDSSICDKIQRPIHKRLRSKSPSNMGSEESQDNEL